MNILTIPLSDTIEMLMEKNPKSAFETIVERHSWSGIQTRNWVDLILW